MWETPDEMEDLYDLYCLGGDVRISLITYSHVRIL